MQDLFDWDSAQGYLMEINTGSPYGQEPEKLTWVYCNLNKKYLCCQDLYEHCFCCHFSSPSSRSAFTACESSSGTLGKENSSLLALLPAVFVRLGSMCVDDWRKRWWGSGGVLYSKGGVVMQLINTSFLHWLYWLFCTASARMCERVPLWNVTTRDVMLSQKMSVQSAFD